MRTVQQLCAGGCGVKLAVADTCLDKVYCTPCDLYRKGLTSSADVNRKMLLAAEAMAGNEYSDRFLPESLQSQNVPQWNPLNTREMQLEATIDNLKASCDRLTKQLNEVVVRYAKGRPLLSQEHCTCDSDYPEWLCLHCYKKMLA